MLIVAVFTKKTVFLNGSKRRIAAIKATILRRLVLGMFRPLRPFITPIQPV